MVTHLQCRVTNWKQWLFAAGFWGNKGKSGGLNAFFFFSFELQTNAKPSRP